MILRGAGARLLGPLLCVALLIAAKGGQTATPQLLASPEQPGPNEPPAGASLFDEVFAHQGGAALPYPFERLLAALAPWEPVTALIPLGRSLQRFGASPDYFASPRIVVAVAQDPGAPGRPFLKDRLFLGFQERAQAIEVISYNEAAGRFELQVVEDYGPGLTPRVAAAERAICVACHQAHGPIFPSALWSETNANPQVVERLSPLGARFNGAAVRGGVDQAEAIDAATDRAARLVFANAVWAMGCGGETRAAAQCRGELLLGALLFRLAGARPETAEARRYADDLVAERLRSLAPGGMGAPSPDLPNRDPISLVLAGAAPDEVIEPEGVFQPLRPRAPILFLPGGAPLSIEIASAFADADIFWLDRTLIALAETQPGAIRRSTGPVEARLVALDGGGRELRFASRTGAPAQMAGHLSLAGESIAGGVVRAVGHGGEAPARWLQAVGGLTRSGAAGSVIQVELREAGLGLAPRLPSGERIQSLRLRMDDAEGELASVDDLAPLRAAVATLVAATSMADDAALSQGPLRRRAILRELSAALVPQ